MMEMEMNAELDGDDGSESSQSSSARSSASSTFCNLEKDYARITLEMKSNEALACFEAEYARLFESLYKTYKNEKELSEQCIMLKEEIMEKTYKIHELTEMMKRHEDEITRLKGDVVNMTKLADAAHTREQNAQEVIENLRLTITKLGLEIEQKNKQLAAEKDTTISKQKENLLKEREKLLGEMETTRQRIKNMSIYIEELEKKNSEVDHRMSEMQETLGMQLNEISREKRARERAEVELRQLQEEISVKKNELETANATIEVNASNITKLEELVKEHKTTGEKMQKEINKLILKKMNLQTDLDNANFETEKLEKELFDNEKLLKNVRHELSKTKQDITKCKHEKGMTDKRLQRVEIERSRLESEHKQALIDIKNTEQEILICRKEQHDNKQHIETLLREKNILLYNKETIREQVKRLNRELLLSANSKKKIEQELDTAIQSIEDVKKQLKTTEKERDRCSATIQGLERQIESYKSAEKLKEVEIFDYKKRLVEAETKYQQQQSLFDTVRAERNLYSKSLVEAQEEVRELKSKLKITYQQIEQLKEDIATKEASLIKKEFLMGKIEKEKENLKVDLQASHMEILELRQEAEKAKQEEKRLRQTIYQTDINVGRLKKNIDNIMNERDILGTQMVRRNDELSLQYGRIKVLNRTLQRGETEYNRRLEDIRLLKFEVKRLRTEKTLLIKNVINASDLRQEIFHLNRDLARERLKVTVLEEEIQTPLNIHRWRKLEGVDPSTFELTKKVQILQKRILKLSADVIDKERQLKDTEKLNINLRDVLSKQQDPKTMSKLHQIQNALRKRGEKLKCLVAELNIYEAQAGEYKNDMAKMENKICELKIKYYTQNRKLQKLKKENPKSAREFSLPDITGSKKKFYGGGFNMITQNPDYSIFNFSGSRIN